MNINGVRDIVFEQNYSRRVDAMIRHNVQFNVAHVLSRIEMMILIEAEEVRKNGGDDTPLVNLVKNIRQTFSAPPQEDQEETAAQSSAEESVAEPDKSAVGSKSAKIFNFDLSKS